MTKVRRTWSPLGWRRIMVKSPAFGMRRAPVGVLAGDSAESTSVRHGATPFVPVTMGVTLSCQPPQPLQCVTKRAAHLPRTGADCPLVGDVLVLPDVVLEVVARL